MKKRSLIFLFLSAAALGITILWGRARTPPVLAAFDGKIFLVHEKKAHVYDFSGRTRDVFTLPFVPERFSVTSEGWLAQDGARFAREDGVAGEGPARRKGRFASAFGKIFFLDLKQSTLWVREDGRFVRFLPPEEELHDVVDLASEGDALWVLQADPFSFVRVGPSGEIEESLEVDEKTLRVNQRYLLARWWDVLRPERLERPVAFGIAGQKAFWVLMASPSGRHQRLWTVHVEGERWKIQEWLPAVKGKKGIQSVARVADAAWWNGELFATAPQGGLWKINVSTRAQTVLQEPRRRKFFLHPFWSALFAMLCLFLALLEPQVSQGRLRLDPAGLRAMLYSLIFPGLGLWLAGRKFLFAFLFGAMVFWAVLFGYFLQKVKEGSFVSGAVFMEVSGALVVFYLLGAVFSYREGKKRIFPHETSRLPLIIRRTRGRS